MIHILPQWTYLLHMFSQLESANKFYTVSKYKRCHSFFTITFTNCTGQHPSYGDCLEVKREYYQNFSVMDCMTQWSQLAVHYMSSSHSSNRLGLSHWDPYAVCRGGFIELYYCNMMEWFWWDASLISMTNWFLQCFDTVGLVIWPVKMSPK